jgi:hypothetical protein
VVAPFDYGSAPAEFVGKIEADNRSMSDRIGPIAVQG